MGGAASLGVSVALAACATLSKETGVTTLAVAAALDALRALRESDAQRQRHRQPSGARPLLWWAARAALGAAATCSLLLFSRRVRGEQLSPHFSFVDNPLPSLPSRRARLLSAAHVHLRYARLLLWPSPLSADYSYNCVPMVERLGDARNASSLALYAALAACAAPALASAARAARRACARPADWRVDWPVARRCGAPASLAGAAPAAAALLVLPFLPASHLVPIGTLVAERAPLRLRPG